MKVMHVLELLSFMVCIYHGVAKLVSAESCIKIF